MRKKMRKMMRKIASVRKMMRKIAVMRKVMRKTTCKIAFRRKMMRKMVFMRKMMRQMEISSSEGECSRSEQHKISECHLVAQDTYCLST